MGLESDESGHIGVRFGAKIDQGIRCVGGYVVYIDRSDGNAENK
jgi:hypothetical protein